MAQDIVNENQNLSYTNLDFSSIYTEVLDMVKQLTKNWDPSISDESDPGVVLVKLSALLADKMNYNIDKNILEAFPLSVTQDSNARQLYEQLGYYMSWYKAATVPVTLSWKTQTTTENGEIVSYIIPKFTPITDENETVVYSLIGTDGPDDVVVSDGVLYTDSSKNLNMIAYEGIPVQYTFNDRTVITPNMVDNNNRLYLSTAYVFENGIFIKNTTQDNYSEWHRVNNLYEYSYNVHRYKFGYDSASNLCYLEFPDNYAELFGSGIEIVYLTFSTDESYSDVPTQFLSKFLTPLAVGEEGDVALTPEKVKISNTASASGHADKEDINKAYTNYKKVVGTFKTLITLRDYLNYIRSKELDVCSNAFVTDRTNDVQSSYKIVNRYKDVDSIINEVEKDDNNIQLIKTLDEDIISNKKYYIKDSSGNFVSVLNPDINNIENYYEMQGEDVLSPFALKFYLLQKSIALTSRAAYDDTFDFTTEKIDVETLLEDTSHLVHTFKDIKPLNLGVFIPSNDEIPDIDISGNINKLYFKYNTVLHRYEPIPVTSLAYQSYNPQALGLFTKDNYYTHTNDMRWVVNKVYYYKQGNNYQEFTNQQAFENVPPKDVIYSINGNTSYIYEYVTEYTATTDTSIMSNTIYYEKQEDGSFKKAVLPDALGIYGVVSNDQLVLTLNSATFRDAVQSTTGVYEFTYDGEYWNYNNQAVNLEGYGITITGNPSSGNKISVYFDVISPTALGLYEQVSEPLMPHIVMFKNKYPINMSIATYSVVGPEVRDDIRKNIISAFYKNLDSSSIEFGDKISLDYLTQIVKEADARIKNVAFEALTYVTYAVYWDEYQQSFIEVRMPASSADVNKDNLFDSPSLESYLGYLFGKDVICKSILAGTTQLLIPEDDFSYHLNQKFMAKHDGIKYITGEAVIDMNIQAPYVVINEDTNPRMKYSYTLQPNETLTLFKPLVSAVESYTAGVHYEYRTFANIDINQSYQLKANEFFIFYISNLDSDGLLKSITVYVYGEGAIINPTFALDKRDESLTTYGQEAVKLWGTAAASISANTKLYSYTESRAAMLVQINNDQLISNTKIGTNDSISAQILNTFTINNDEGYRFIWSLNTPTYEGTLKQYKLLDGYNPEDDINLTNLDAINSYTLKSGEYLYYTDASLSNLGILGAGTTIYRNCGVDSVPSEITSMNPFVFVKWQDLVNSTSAINASGFDVILNINNRLNPLLNGFYEQVSSDVFVRSTDEDAVEGKDYYILLMRDVSGWYVKQGDETKYVVSPYPTTSVFSPIDIKSRFLAAQQEDLNPNSSEFYEQITYQGVSLADTYYLPNKECLTSDEYINNGKVSYVSTTNRYARSLDTSVISAECVQNTDGVYIFTSAPYGDVYNTYSPKDEGWIHNTAGEGATYYNWEEAALTDTLFNQETNVTYESLMPQGTYYNFGKTDLLFRYNNTNNKESYVMLPIEAGDDTEGSIISGSTNSSVNSLQNIFNKYKIQLSDTYTVVNLIEDVQYAWRMSNHKLTSSPIADWTMHVFNDLNTAKQWVNMTDADNGKYAILEESDVSNVNQFNIATINILQNNLRLGFVKTTTSLTQDSNQVAYSVALLLKINNDTRTLSFGRLNTDETIALCEETNVFKPLKSVAFKYNGYLFRGDTSDQINFTSGEDMSEYLGQGWTSSLDGTSLDKCTKDNTYCICSYRDNVNDVITWLTYVKSIFQTRTFTTGIYFLPYWYTMEPWYKFIDKQYYTVNSYGTKIYSHVDPLVCPALDSLELSSNPLSIMRTAFQSIQPNTSLTFTQNQLYTLSAGDTISIETDEDVSSPNFALPIFTNKDTVLDLNNYDVTYKRVGDDIVTLDKLQVENCDWRGYSNLQLNTDSSEGQKLYPNQSLTLYDESKIMIGNEITGLDDGDTGNVHFQLQYPMSNLSGTYIQVSTSSMTQENILNAIYVYSLLPDETYYSFIPETHSTHVYCKKSDIVADYNFIPSGININNLKLDSGEYLIPVNGISGIRIELTYTIQSDTPTTIVLTSYMDGNKTYFLGDKLHFAYLNVPVSEASGTLNVRVCNPDGTDLTPEADTSITVVLNDIFKFRPNDLLGTEFDRIKDKILELDVNQRFDYTHIPDKDDIIVDPVQSKEFWNKNHIYNSFTIAQLNADSIDYKFIT